ncbi:ATP-binding protein [Leifsonia sp. NPDC014704]|uniref:ATP-binding protein n=1 Tax=Leifsonia sp. NPDC014704 TaxID=3364123 RepID=UPI0036F46513
MQTSNSTHGLPVRLDPMIGRREEVSLIRRLLQTSNRLVTVTGTAGVGKSRVAIAAAESLRRSVSGVWYVDVRGRGHDVALAVAQELKVDPGDDALGAVIAAVGDEDALLVIDDADEAVAETSAMVDALLLACPGVRAIVTSREPPASAAQALVAIGPFAHRDLTAGSDAVRLFADRAASGDALFSVDESTLPEVVTICEATYGVPLAIELAAAQLQFMDVRTLAGRISHQLDTLEPAAAESRSLRAAVEDSWDRCTETERHVWTDLAVLAPGWDLDLGESMAALSADGPREARTALKQLIRRSVVHRRRVQGDVRYELLPALREFGAEQATHPEDAQGHFVSCMLLRLHDAEDNWFGGRQREILQRLRGDIANIRRAVSTAAALGDTDRAVEVAVTAWRQAWMLHGSGDEVATWLGTAFASGRPSPFWAAQGHALRAAVFGQTGKPGLARSELATARAALEEVANGDDAEATHDCAVSVRSAAEVIDADDRRALELLRILMDELGEDAYRFGRTNTPQRLAARLHALGERAEGSRVGDDITERALVVGDRFERSFVLTTRASACAAVREYETTEADAREALVVKRGLGNGLGVAQSLELLADVAREHADPARGATLLGAAAARWRDAGAIRANYPPYFYDRASTERALRHRLGADAFDRAFAYGAALSEDESIDFALHGMVEARTRTGIPDSSRTPELTPREGQVAALVADGASNKEIARQLFVSIRTVETHVQNALVKLGLRSRTELALWHREQLSRG